MANLATLEFRPSPGEQMTGSLYAVRRALETAGLMARGDIFLTKDLVEISADAESKHTLETASKEATGGLRVLTVRLGPKKSAVKVVKGEASWSLMPDVTQTLASYRNELAAKNLMTAEDRFWMSGAPVLDESDFSVEQAVEKGVLTIGPPGSHSSQTILVAKGVKLENLKFLQVDVRQNLGQLRAKLEADGIMAKGETFADGDGAAISRSEEAGRLIKDAAGANKLLAIISQGWI